MQEITQSVEVDFSRTMKSLKQIAKEKVNKQLKRVEENVKFQMIRLWHEAQVAPGWLVCVNAYENSLSSVSSQNCNNRHLDCKERQADQL